jgi:hypothetical protein
LAAKDPHSDNVDSLSTSRRAGTAIRRRRRIRLWVSIGSGVIISGILGLVVAIQGYVSGLEFAPSHFQSRQFSFYEIPVVHWQITPIQRKVAKDEVLDFVRLSNWVPTAKGQPTQWHLVSLAGVTQSSRPNDPALLIDAVKGNPWTKENPWYKWSTDHPKNAAVLWPQIQTLAQRELYFLIPGLLRIARPITDPVELKTKMNDYLRDEYRSLVSDLREAGQDTLADELKSEAVAEGWMNP